ncbi:MAG TPA: hypothetical protein VHM25_07400 [Polyangiaceae bacterium]|nr:hypothetical protein [Polyangiaceae bacterium]
MSTSIEKTHRSFLQRPEGRVGLVVSALVLVAGGYGLFLVLPTLITFAENVLELAGLCLALAVVFYALADRKIRTFLSYVYQAFFRLLTGFFIELDPIGILRHHIVELTAKLQVMRSQLGELNGQIRGVERAISENTRLSQNSLALAQAGRNDPEHVDASRLQARHAIKLEESNARLGAMQTQMQTLFRMLKKLSDTSELVLQDMQSTVDIKTRERSSMKAAYSAYRGALSILQGQSEGRDLYDRTMEFLNDDYARKLGEIEMFMDFSDGVIKAADLENLAYDARASERLDEWERRLVGSLLGGGEERVAGVPRGNQLSESSPQRVPAFAARPADPLDALLQLDARPDARKLPPAPDRR